MKCDFTKEKMIILLDKNSETIVKSKNVNVGMRL